MRVPRCICRLNTQLLRWCTYFCVVITQYRRQMTNQSDILTPLKSLRIALSDSAADINHETQILRQTNWCWWPQQTFLSVGRSGAAKDSGTAASFQFRAQIVIIIQLKQKMRQPEIYQGSETTDNFTEAPTCPDDSFGRACLVEEDRRLTARSHAKS